MNTEQVRIDALKPHPRNYRAHPDDQIAHLVANIRDNGLYRNIVVANDSTILAGHGVVEACRKLNITEVTVVRLPFGPDDPRALKVLTGDNEVSRLGEVDDRALTEILKELSTGPGLEGTGFDQETLANLVFVTRPEGEIKDIDEAREWVGLPSYDEGSDIRTNAIALVVTFDTKEEREKFCTEKGIGISKYLNHRWMTHWPFHGRQDRKSVRFEGEKPE